MAGRAHCLLCSVVLGFAGERGTWQHQTRDINCVLQSMGMVVLLSCASHSNRCQVAYMLCSQVLLCSAAYVPVMYTTCVSQYISSDMCMTLLLTGLPCRFVLCSPQQGSSSSHQRHHMCTSPQLLPTRQRRQ